MNKTFQIILIFLFLFSFHWGAIGQSNTDSLEFRLEFEKDPIVKVELLEKISRQLKYQNIDKSLDYAQQALQLATDIEDDKAIINLSLTLSDIYWIKTDYEEAMNWAILAEELSEKNNLQKGLARSYLTMGAIYSSIDNYDKSSEFYFKSLKIFLDLGERKYEGIVLNNIGNIFSDQKKFDKATKYYSQAYNIALDVNDSEGVKIGLTNYASALSNMDKY